VERWPISLAIWAQMASMEPAAAMAARTSSAISQKPCPPPTILTGTVCPDVSISTTRLPPLSSQGKEVDGAKGQELPTFHGEFLVVLDPEIEELLRPHQRDPAIFLATNLMFGVGGKPTR
jgi:hypothetical protein